MKTSLFFLTLCLFQSVTPLLGDTLHVFALSGLHLRMSAPDGAVISIIPYGAQLENYSYQPHARRDTIENLPGEWIKTAWQGQEGYVFDGFLSRLPAPALDVQSLDSYAERYFARIEGSGGKYRYRDHQVAFADAYFEGTDAGEGHGFSIEMTIEPGSFSATDMYLLMRALFRRYIDDVLRDYKDADHPQKKDLNYFQFVPKADSGSFDLGSIRIGYGQCFHGAYISFDYTD